MYTKTETGDFRYQGSVAFHTPAVALVFDTDGYVLLKHGPPALVRDYYLQATQALIQGGRPDMAQDWLYVESPHWVEEDLNRILSCVGSAPEILAAMQLTSYRVNDN
jgi:hypothetical protein